jgi:hypothetical protein
VNTPIPEKLSEADAVKRIAQDMSRKPGMYLIALRTHLSTGRKMIGDILTSVKDALPDSSEILRSESRSENQ